MAKKNRAVVDAPVEDTEEVVVRDGEVPVEEPSEEGTTVETPSAPDTPVDNPPTQEVTEEDPPVQDPPVQDTTDDSASNDADPDLTKALADAGEVLGIEDVTALPETADTAPLTDGQIQSVLTPLLKLAGDVPVETATSLS